jgi:two-component system cell cycle sensor histidine kinase/response regulator CckA
MNPNQLTQILLNLLLNARDAMPEGGQLTVETGNVTLGADVAHSYGGIQPGRYVVLKVRDTGVGIDAKVLKHVFQPFFTTKERGKGTGLGLATLREIIWKNSGSVLLESAAVKGTVVSVYLPANP